MLVVIKKDEWWPVLSYDLYYGKFVENLATTEPSRELSEIEFEEIEQVFEKFESIQRRLKRYYEEGLEQKISEEK